MTKDTRSDMLDAEKALNAFESGEVIAATVNFDDPVWKWHRRLGHLGFQNMLNLLDSSTGMEITPEQIRAKLKAVCPVCAITRALIKIPRDPAKRHAQDPGQMVHVDVWGPYPIEGFDGTKYFLFITDDCTRYTWSARFDHKYQLLEVFKSLVKFIQKAYNITIRCCRLDNEFENGPVGRWCDAHSIAREPIEPYAHYQNGVAERTNRTIREKTAPIVQETFISGQVSKIISEKGTELLRISRIPENLWPEAIQHAVWLKNRTPARALRKKDAKTPYEALRGAKPTLTRERIWGSRAYVTYPREFRNTAEMTKLHSPRGWLGYFVGCESEAMYHIYSPEKHKVYRIGVARVEDGEGLDDPHDAPCLEDRVPTPDVEVPDHLTSEGEDEIPGDHDGNLDGDGDFRPFPEEAGSLSDSEPERSTDIARIREEHASQGSHQGRANLQSPEATGREQPAADTMHRSQVEIEDADDEDEGDTGRPRPAVVSKYFAQSGHAGMAKRKIADNTMVAPEGSRQATHDQGDADQNDSSSETSDASNDSWYYSDDGKVSRAYWNFVSKHGGHHMKNYLPNDDKCDRCFRNGRICDSAENEMPCSTCKNEKKACRPQSKETKRLVLPENRNRLKEIGGSLQDPPCRRCLQTSRSCYLVGPTGSQCEGCKKANRRCSWSLDGAKKSMARQKRREAEKQAKHEKLGFVPVPRDQKCYRCAKRRMACDGRYPCNKCNTINLRLSCRPQEVEALPSCTPCSYTSGQKCDRGRPCKGCINRKTTCTYEAQNGLLSRSYQVPDAPFPRGFSSVGPLAEGESSDEECVRCQRQKLNCNGEQPCYPCVKAQGSIKIATCRYRRSDGRFDRLKQTTQASRISGRITRSTLVKGK
jgi:hypothetical protein